MEVWAYLGAHLLEKGYPPTVREIQDALRFKTSSTATHHLRALERRGILTREYAAARGIRLLKTPFLRWASIHPLDRRAADLQAQGALVYWDFNLTGFVARFPDHRPAVVIENAI